MTPHVSLPSPAELTEKHRRVAVFLERHRLDGVLLGSIANFSWISGGRTNRVGAATEMGAGALLVTADRRFLVADEIEAPRLLEEELAGQAVELLSYPWYAPDPAASVRQVLGGAVAADLDVPRLEPLPPEFSELRWSLTEEEIERYRWVGEHAGMAVTQALFHLRPGLTEHQIAAGLAETLGAVGLQPTVLLVAADDRIARFRHPLPTEQSLKRAAMIAVSTQRWGLTASLTRLVHFGQPDAELQRRHAAVTAVDAALIGATRPERGIEEVFRTGISAYMAHGFPDEWQRHHQGGPTGYRVREYRATPDSPHRVRDRQAFAWNPSIAGTRSEDTVLITEAGAEVLTVTPDLPQLVTEGMLRPGILVR